ncbi:dienelactone hydrolase family protein [Plantactinospora solaniradicis]|uniref:Dienelactone hydrolase family protein n=1 Tax=Plantactinospora solaniradicis TaxID=1723736 RepID=A0ABW1K4X1_9ACTN
MKRRSFVSLPALAMLPPTMPGAAPPTGLTETGGSVTASAGAAFSSPAIVDGNLPAFYPALADELTFPLAWTRSRTRSFRTWRRTARAKVEELLCQPDDATRFDPEILDERDGDGYLQRTLSVNLTRHSRVRAAMLVPRGRGPHPAVLLLHDHGSKFDIGKEKLIRPWYDQDRLGSAQAWSDRYFGGRFVGDELARRGYVVLAVDALGWGDRSGLGYEAQQALASNLFHLGSSLAGLTAREDVRMAAFLGTLPYVDRRRIAALGFSMGGYRAWQVAALSDHVAAAASVCWMTTLKAMMVPGNNTLRGQSAYFMLHPGLHRHLDIPDVASIAAPKPMLFFNGELDTLFPVAGVHDAYAKMRAVWRSQRADDRLLPVLWPGLGHVFPPEMQDQAFRWLDRWLRST